MRKAAASKWQVKHHNKKANPFERRISKLSDVLGILAMMNNRNFKSVYDYVCYLTFTNAFQFNNTFP